MHKIICIIVVIKIRKFTDTGRLREGVRRNALRVLRPSCHHSEETAQHIEWRDPCGHAAVRLQGSGTQGSRDRLNKKLCNRTPLRNFLQR